MKKLTVLVLMVIVLLLAISKGFSQADPKPKKFDNPQWKEIVYIDFHPGKNERHHDHKGLLYESHKKSRLAGQY